MGIFFLKKKKKKAESSISILTFKTEIKCQSGLNQIRLSDIVEVLANGISQEKKITGNITICRG